MRKLAIILATLALAGFIGIGTHNLITTNNKFEFQKVQLKSQSAEIKQLNIQYDKLNSDLQKTDAQNKEQINKLNKEKQELERKKQELEAQLQAKLDAKHKKEQEIALASSKVLNYITGTQSVSASSGDIQSMIIDAANRYGINANHFLYIAKCESTFNPAVINYNYTANDGSNPTGVFQFIRSTYIGYASQAGFPAQDDRLNAYNNINVAAWAFANGHSSAWECR